MKNLLHQKKSIHSSFKSSFKRWLHQEVSFEGIEVLDRYKEKIKKIAKKELFIIKWRPKNW